MKRLLVVALAGMFGCTALALGQDQSQPPVSDQLVAHLSALDGNVSTQRADTGDWVAGAINTPLVSGDKVAAGAGSRAEVQIDYADLLRLGDNASVNLTNLTKSNIQVQIGAGLADYVVLQGAQATSEIDTPNIAIYPQKAGVYRILVPSNSETQVIVRRGEVEISTPQGSTRLKQGQQITVEGVDSPQYQITDAPPRDSWDQWNQTRDDAVEAAANYDHANRYYTGVQAMNGYGYWTYVPGYGNVWVPDNQGDWTPYSDGRWTWEPYWGWTWVSYEPWGWAPYHYGRWFVYGANWVWWPGPVTPYYRPLWAPAYVSFFGWGGGFGVGVGFGSIGWMPIGPCDPYRPWWGGGGYYSVNYTNINITNVYVTNNNLYRRSVLPPLAVAGHERVAYSNIAMLRTNQRVRSALIRVPRNQFAHGAITARSHVTAAELHTSSVIGGTLPVVPNRASLNAGRVARPGYVPTHAATHFFGQRGSMTSMAARPDFTQERARVQHDLVNAPATRTARPERPAPTRAPAAANQPQHFTSAGSLRPAPDAHAAPARVARTARPGWQSFGRGSGAPQYAAPRNAAPHDFAPRPSSPRSFQPQAAPPRKGPGGSGWQSFHPDRGVSPAPARGPQDSFSPRDNSPRANERPPLEVGHPIMTQPRDSAPEYRAPAYRSPGYSAPAYRAPAYHAPEYRAPAYHAPEYRAPAYRAPAYHAPEFHAPEFHPAPAPHVSSHPGGGGRPHRG